MHAIWYVVAGLLAIPPVILYIAAFALPTEQQTTALAMATATAFPAVVVATVGRVLQHLADIHAELRMIRADTSETAAAVRKLASEAEQVMSAPD